ncbi:MAG: hypothetical protein IKO03_02535 [Lachnospiraceae bacterium]|nr:hypothetical protein [Lachnospiraceae bacterium]
MEKSEFMIKRVFAEEGDLPEIVKMRVQGAYDQIYEQIRAQDASDENNEACENLYAAIRNNGRGLLKVACFVLACLLALGGTAYAVNLILDKYERMKQMEQEEKDQIYEDIQNGGNLNHEESRTFTESESARFFELREKYKANEAFPEGELEVVHEGEKAKGELYLLVKGNHEESVLVLPERELTDEELLQIIEHNEKEEYVLYEAQQKRIAEQGNWESRMLEMTDEEVDFYYLAFWRGRTEVTGIFRRGDQSDEGGNQVLSEKETVTYQEMQRQYLEENRIPMREEPLPVIEMPAEYDGKKVVLCRYNTSFYLPERELTEEDFLEIIDFWKRAEYSLRRVNSEVERGIRKGYPELENCAWEEELEQARDKTVQTEQQFKEFYRNTRPAVEKSLEEATICDIVTFGSYEQDGNVENGKEAIKWYVCDQAGDLLTLLSVDVLDAIAYDKREDQTIAWADSDVRRWLNEEFFGNAFSGAEQAKILTTQIKNDYGGDTYDQVWLLSFEEYIDYFGVQNRRPMGAKETWNETAQRATDDCHLMSHPTQAAISKGVFVWTWEGASDYLKGMTDLSMIDGNSPWLLRTTGPGWGTACLSTYALYRYPQTDATSSLSGIRPVIRIQR